MNEMQIATTRAKTNTANLRSVIAPPSSGPLVGDSPNQCRDEVPRWIPRMLLGVFVSPTRWQVRANTFANRLVSDPALSPHRAIESQWRDNMQLALSAALLPTDLQMPDSPRAIPPGMTGRQQHRRRARSVMYVLYPCSNNSIAIVEKQALLLFNFYSIAI